MYVCIAFNVTAVDTSDHIFILSYSHCRSVLQELFSYKILLVI